MESTRGLDAVIDPAGRPVLGPQPGSATVAAEHIEWHTSQVFRGVPRAAALGN